MVDPNRAAIERQAAGVHPCLRCGRRQHACRLHQPSPLGRCDADHGDRAVIWQADGEGLYDAQRGGDEPWMRGIFKSGNDGRFVVQTVLPVPYSIPMDGSVGEVMSRTGISPMRPSHIHFLIEAKGHRRLVTHLFKKSCPYIETDVVYGVKAPLIAEFKLMPAGSTTPTGQIASQAFWLLEYDFVLQPAVNASAGAPATVAA